MAERNLNTFTRASEYQQKQHIKSYGDKTKIDLTDLHCTEINQNLTVNDNLPICKHSRTLCPYAYNKELTQGCPTRLFYQAFTEKEEVKH